MSPVFDVLAHPIVFGEPRRLTAVSSWQEHIPLVWFLIAEVRPRVVVELGVHAGDSYCAMCQAVQELGLDATCTGVDTFRGDYNTGFYGPEVYRDLAAHHDPLYSDFSRLVKATFDEAAQTFEDGAVDLLHIDGCHLYDAVRRDYETWLPKMSPRGVILFHDTQERAGDFGVWRLWQELVSLHPGFEFEHGHGLGVLTPGSDPPPAITALARLAGPDAAAFRGLFRRLGERWSRGSRLEEAQAARGALESWLEIALAAPPPQAPAGEEPRPRPLQVLDAANDRAAYQVWLKNEAATEPQRRRELAAEVAGLADPPLISVVVPVYRPDLDLLGTCLGSVESQTYGSWEVCICDDGTADPALDRFLEARAGPRVQVERHPGNRGISAATNTAIASSRGRLVAFLDQDDALAPEALAELACAWARSPSARIFYTDEDKVDRDGVRSFPILKPGWSPEHLLAHMYMGHLLAVPRAVLEELGGLRAEFDGSQDHDLALRAATGSAAVHIPRVLYHWRTTEGSAAADEEAKPWAVSAGHSAVQAALERMGEDAAVAEGLHPGRRRVRWRIRGSPSVDVIIPFRDQAGLLERCVASIEETAGWSNFRLHLVDNLSWEPETRAVVSALAANPRCTVHSYAGEFNWAAINNWAARRCDGDLLLFLNNDVEGTGEGWMEALVEHAQRPPVGAVGCRLLYPDGRIQHAGVILGMGGVADHAFRGCDSSVPTYMAWGETMRNYSAVTGACMMVRRAVFDEAGGFDDSYSIAYNDIDFCLRLGEMGYRVVYTPFATLIHHESSSRGVGIDPELRPFARRWSGLLEKTDPYYNPNLSLRSAVFRLPLEPEEPPWRRYLDETPAAGGEPVVPGAPGEPATA